MLFAAFFLDDFIFSCILWNNNTKHGGIYIRNCYKTSAFCKNSRHAIIGASDFSKLYDYYNNKVFDANELFKNKTIELDEVRNVKNEMTKNLRQAVLEIHKAPVTKGKGNDTRWFTPIRKGGKRVIIKKTTHDEVLDALIDFYGVGQDACTLKCLYPKWIKKKLSQGSAPSYIRKIDGTWRKFYEHDKIVNQSLRYMRMNTIKSWLIRQKEQYDLDSKAFYNMQTIFKQIFEFAMEEDLIEKNPFDKIVFSKKVFFKGEQSKTRRLQSSRKQVFLRDEEPIIEHVAMEMYLENKSFTTATAPLGVLLLLQTGLRVGELVALRERDIEEDAIHVELEEQRHYKIDIIDGVVKCKYKGTRVGKAKTDASYRTIPLTTRAKELIALVRQTNMENGFHFEDFLFVNANGRMQENTILKHLYRICERANIERRSPHKCRKTFGSNLVNSGNMDLSEVAQLLGHTSEKTLIEHYLYTTRDEGSRRARMEQSLCG